MSLLFSLCRGTSVPPSCPLTPPITPHRKDNASLIQLTTTGARTGRKHRVTLGAMNIDGQLVVVASAMGLPKHPAWYHNIRKNPLVTVETGTETFEAMAAVAPDRDALFAKVVEQQPGFADYQARTTRVLPVIVLRRLG
ncbi:nitroreductase family deazaflavin-dependent oxidoreductase [Amycolatopsis sp., V23-08]|uniref:Nitroreductase family deazaflavin-dependent oxidoreductase n=1 Tax=Amycolatopsis heterodermiae TaxID=3110235 RepID=A0ABU5QVV3_9PSEU|nr:nitroreductase family deazaflavin-dependent oxidoreductase [Amycolatopsis sp., V23-08]MEA5358047.1 nitroreductase family deazaflavin-dependent oxidoreductase [Amycolatopsis sp., V23-08]